MADSVLFREKKHYCVGCGIEFIPQDHIPDMDMYCTMCVYGPFLHIQELAVEVAKYANAIREILDSDDVNEVRIAKMGKALQLYHDRLQKDLTTLKESVMIMNRMKNE